jgi:hypothetical protein
LQNFQLNCCADVLAQSRVCSRFRLCVGLQPVVSEFR